MKNGKEELKVGNLEKNGIFKEKKQQIQYNIECRKQNRKCREQTDK